MKLPRPDSTIDDIELKKVNSDTIVSVFENQKQGKVYHALATMLLGSIKSINGEKPNINQVKSFPLVNAEYLILESFKMFDIQTYLEGVYPCPRMGCGNKVIQELTKDSDTRVDVSNLEVNYSSDTEPYTILVNHNIEKSNQIINIQSMSFRDITINDLIKISAKNNSIKNRIKEIFLETLIDINFESEPELNVNQLKNRYYIELFDFDDYRITEEIIRGYRKFGIQLFQELSCPKCGKEWESPIDFTSFFVYALNSMSGGMGKGI